MKKKYEDADMLDPKIEGEINEEAEKLNYLFETLILGGKKTHKKTIKKKKIRRNRRKSVRGNSRR